MTNSKTLRIATWNIAGGPPVCSKAHFDYEPEDRDYFAVHLPALEADVICLQEVNMNRQRSLGNELAMSLGMYEVFESPPLSSSHIDLSYQLGMAITHENAAA